MNTVTSAALTLTRATVSVGSRKLIDDVSLAIPARGLVGIVGPNGSGKTTLLRAAMGLMPLQGGSIELSGRSLGDWPARDFARHIGYVAQRGVSHWDLTVAEMLCLSAPALPEELVARCELHDLLPRRFATLSGGEKARVSVARALAHGPRLLLADEPAAHLDIPHHHRLMALLQDSASERAVVVVLHDLHVASRWCEQVVLISQGRVLSHGAPHDVLTPERLAQAYGVPIVAHDAGGLRFYTAAAELPST